MIFLIFSSKNFSWDGMERSTGVAIASLNVAPGPIVKDVDKSPIEFAMMQRALIPCG